MHEALEKNFNWVVRENPFDERSRPKGSDRGNSEPCISKIQCIYDFFSTFLWMILLIKLEFALSA